MISQGKQAGAALLSILLIVATLSVAALMATEVIARQTELQKLSARRTSANWAARSAEAAAISSASDLVSGSRLPAGAYDTDRQLTLTLPMEGGQIVLTLRELPPCFNLNALANPDEASSRQQTDVFAVLLEDMGVSSSEAANVTAILSDWIDADSTEKPGGGEDAFYLAQQAGYRSAGQLILSPSEINSLPRISAGLRGAIAALTCIVPDTDALALNVNALSLETAPVLRAATRGALSLAESRRFIEARPANGWSSVQAVQAFLEGRTGLATALADVPLAAQGTYFLGEGYIQLDAGRWPFRFMMRAASDGSPEIVWRAFGGAG